jgi:hypothetical protein
MARIGSWVTIVWLPVVPAEKDHFFPGRKTEVNYDLHHMTNEICRIVIVWTYNELIILMCDPSRRMMRV